MQIITAPSKTQDTTHRVSLAHSIPVFLHKSEKIIERLRQFKRNELAVILKTSDKLTNATLEKLKSFATPFSLENSCQAIFTFQGDAYSAIRAEEYSDEQIEHAQGCLNILSGLYGILRPLDLMQPYRLEMGTRINIGSSENLYKFWTEEITERMNKRLETGERKVVNLASTEYSKVLKKKSLRGELVTIVFKQPSKKGLKTIPIHSKRARGLMIHYTITNKIDKSEDLKEFNLDGYAYQPDESSSDSWLFVKKNI